MKIKNIHLKNFRNHTEYRVTPHARVNIFTGENGQGKTSILEALSLCLRGKSFRYGRNWVQKEKKRSSILIDFESEYGKGRIQAELQEEGRLNLFYNGKKTNNFPHHSLCIFFTPDDLYAIRGEASFRRKLIDDLVFQTEPSVCQKFNRILNQKNRFLKLCKQGRYNLNDQKIVYNSLQEAFVYLSEKLIQARFQALEEIRPFWKKEGFFFLQTHDFEVRYLTQKRACLTLYETLENFKKELKEKEALEKIKGCSLVGPHRDDLQFLYQQCEARENLSQGQQKALLLSWKLAQWSQSFKQNKPQVPSLFFDDVFSEIDQHYQKNLLEFLLENQAQSFITIPVWNFDLMSVEGDVFDLGSRIQREYDGKEVRTE